MHLTPKVQTSGTQGCYRCTYLAPLTTMHQTYTFVSGSSLCQFLLKFPYKEVAGCLHGIIQKSHIGIYVTFLGKKLVEL
uniref:Uncharacterized protein n=1 Tax=Rhizophora mucronata TaxID=61149 RepID=A0A2P2PI90_RHIMU